MTDEEYRQQVQKRWQESMALLGLDDAGPAPEPKTTAEPRPALAKASRMPTPEIEHVEAPPPAPFDGPSEEPVEAAPSGSEAERSEEEQGRRRRGRRGGRGKRPESAGTAAEGKGKGRGGEKAVRDSEEPGERESGGRRGRGKPRQRPAKPPETEAAEMDESASDKTNDDNDFGDDDTTDLSEWNVPSWQDLIASLYRPDR